MVGESVGEKRCDSFIGMQIADTQILRQGAKERFPSRRLKSHQLGHGFSMAGDNNFFTRFDLLQER